MRTLFALTLLASILMTSSCKDNDTSGEPVKEESGTRFTNFYVADFYVGGELGQYQYYKHERDSNVQEYSEVGKFLSDSSIVAKARIKTIDGMYDQVEISFKNSSIETNVLVSKEGDKFYSYLNGTIVDSVEMGATEVLFDGPNPTFDYVNGLIAMNGATDVAVDHDVYLVNWINGTLSKNLMEFTELKMDQNRYFQVMKYSPDRTRLIYLNDNSLPIDSCRLNYDVRTENNEYYTFKTLDNDPGLF